jgi:hypothetical protein
MPTAQKTVKQVPVEWVSAAIRIAADAGVRREWHAFLERATSAHSH